MCIYFIKFLSLVFKMYEFSNLRYVEIMCILNFMKIIIIRVKLVDLE